MFLNLCYILFRTIEFMNITIVQFTPELFKKCHNIETMLRYIESINSDIIVFPELSTSGYYYLEARELFPFSEKSDGETFKIFQELSTQKNSIIIYGFPELAGEKIYNSAAMIFPTPKYSSVYRKTHLFYKERFCFAEGNTGFFVIDYKEWDLKIGCMICYDWRFPEAARTLGLKGADLIVCPSNLVTKVWRLAMPTRALENKVYLAVANRVGSETRDNDTLLFNGQSVIYDYDGNVLTEADVTTNEVISAEIFPSKTRDKSFNQFNDINKDRRPEFYYK